MIEFSVVAAEADSVVRNRASRYSNVNWCRLNDKTVYWAAPDGRSSLPDELRVPGGAPETAKGDLYLVGQMGNAFLSHFPWTRVVVNKGRYLAVDLSADEVEQIGHNSACFGLLPLPENTTVLETRARTQRAPVAEIAALVNSVSQTRLSQTLTTLAGFRTRHSLSSEFIAAAGGMKSELEALGFTVTNRAISVGSGTSLNVVADRAGLGTTRRLVIVTAHLDSVNTAGGVTAAAPGADDNGSGAAGLLEIARVMASQSFENDLRLILFGGEEQGLHGSRQYVASLPMADRNRLDSVINMDMIATLNSATLTVLLEGANVSQALMNDLADAAHDYTSLTVQTSLNPFASDHVPFINESLPALLTIEGADSANHNIHTANDTLDHIH